MKEYQYELTRYRIYVYVLIVLSCIFCNYLIRTAFDSSELLAKVCILILSIFPLYLVKIGLWSLINNIINAPHVVTVDNNRLIISKMFNNSIIEIGNISQIYCNSPFWNDNIYNVKFILNTNNRPAFVMAYGPTAKELAQEILKKNEACIVDATILDNTPEVKRNIVMKYLYPWYVNIHIGIIILIVVVFFMSLAASVALYKKIDIFYFIILAMFLSALFSVLKYIGMFFINKPYKLIIKENILIGYTGINTKHEINIADINKVYFSKGVLNLICVNQGKKKYYFDFNLIGYKHLLTQLKHLNPKIEIDHKSIFAAEEKERKRKR